MPRSFEKHPLLRVHVGSLSRRDAEKGSVEAIMPVDEPAPLSVGLCSVFGITAPMGGAVPSVSRNLTHAVGAIAQHVPELALICCTWKAGGQSDDGYGIFGQAGELYGCCDRCLRRRHARHGGDRLGQECRCGMVVDEVGAQLSA